MLFMKETETKEELKQRILVKKAKEAKRSKIIKIVFLVALAVIGILAIVWSSANAESSTFGANYKAQYTGTYKSPYHLSYGGDAYTGIQNAAADTANNVAEVGKATESGLKNVDETLKTINKNVLSTIGECEQLAGAVNKVLLVIGLLLVCISTYLLVKTLTERIKLSMDEIDALTEYYATAKKPVAIPDGQQMLYTAPQNTPIS